MKLIIFFVIFLFSSNNTFSQIIEIEEAVIFYSGENFTKQQYYQPLITDDTYFYEFEILDDWGASSHWTVPIIKNIDGVDYYVSIQEVFTKIGYCNEVYSWHQLGLFRTNYDNYCIGSGYEYLFSSSDACNGEGS